MVRVVCVLTEEMADVSKSRDTYRKCLSSEVTVFDITEPFSREIHASKGLSLSPSAVKGLSPGPSAVPYLKYLSHNMRHDQRLGEITISTTQVRFPTKRPKKKNARRH